MGKRKTPPHILYVRRGYSGLTQLSMSRTLWNGCSSLEHRSLSSRNAWKFQHRHFKVIIVYGMKTYSLMKTSIFEIHRLRVTRVLVGHLLHLECGHGGMRQH